MKQRLNLPLALSLAGILLMAGALLTPGPVLAGTPLGTPGPAGEVYLVRVGTASELLPNAEPDDDRRILALEILRPGEDPEWIEVPESEGVSADASHFVLFEESSNTLFLVWQTRIGSHPIIKLASFREGSWAEVVPVSDNVWNFKGHPRLAVTRDTFAVEEDGEVRTVERTLLHVVWWEDTLEGIRVLYRPLILEGGRLQGMGEVYVVNDLIDLSNEETSDGEASRLLLESPVLQPGRDSSSVVTGFVDAKTGRLAVAEIRLLPMGLGKLGNDVAEFIIDHPPEGAEPGSEGELRSLAGPVRSKILIGGNRHRLNPRAVQQIADEIHEGMVSGSIAAPSTAGLAGQKPEPQEELRSLAGVVRSKILIGGARIAGETLDRFNQAAAPSVLEMETEDPAWSEGGGAPHLVRTLLLSSASTPELGAEAEAEPQLFISPDGTDVVVAWAEPSALAYRKAVDGTWSETRRMGLSDELTLTDALEILRRSVRPVH